METKKKAKFRVICKDLEHKKHRTFTVYEDDNDMDFDDFVKTMEEKIEEI